jgi:hypothetical protein
MAQVPSEISALPNLDRRCERMKKKTTVMLQPEVDDLCDLIARIIARPSQGEEGRADEPHNNDDDQDDNASSALTPQHKG